MCHYSCLYRGSGPPSNSGQEPFQYTTGPNPPVIMCSLQGPGQPWDQHPWQLCVTRFTGREAETSMIPQWVCRALSTGQVTAVPGTKASFLLMPLQVKSHSLLHQCILLLQASIDAVTPAQCHAMHLICCTSLQLLPFHVCSMLLTTAAVLLVAQTMVLTYLTRAAAARSINTIESTPCTPCQQAKPCLLDIEL